MDAVVVLNCYVQDTAGKYGKVLPGNHLDFPQIDLNMLRSYY